MTWIAMALRKAQLKKEVSNMTLDLTHISKEIQDLHSYTNNIADGKITLAEGASCPSSLFGTQLDFMQNASQAAYQSASAKTSAYMQQLAATNAMEGRQSDGLYDQTTIFNDIYEQELKEYASQMMDEVNAMEEELEQEKDRIETQLQAKEAELKAYEQRISQNIQNDAIKLG